MNQRRGSRGFWQILLLALVVAIGGFAAWRYTSAAKETSYQIETAQLSRGSIERSISATGAVQAVVTVSVSSQLSGQISDLKVDFNSKVAKGDSLAVIDPRTFASRVASAEAALANAKTTVDVQGAAIAKAKALLDQAQKTVERQRTLAANNSTPAATFETAETALETAKADLQVAEAQLANAKATVQQREADLAQARLDLDRTQIRSPIDGVVIARNIDLGATVAVSLQAPVLFQIAQDLLQIQILVLVDEADIGSIDNGQDVTFTVDAFPDRVFNGKVEQVRIAGTTTNNVVTYTVVVRAQNPQQKLLPGMTATVRIVTGSRQGVLRVPNEAVRFNPPKGLKTTEAAERPNRDEAIIASLSDKLKLTPEQVDQFRSGLAATRRSAPQGRETSRRDGGDNDLQTSVQVPRREGAAAGTAANGAPERRGRVTGVLEGILTPEQTKVFQTLRDEWRDTTRPANIWTETPNGLQPHRFLLGLSDDNFSEVLRSDLKAGDSVVSRARRDSGGSDSGGSTGNRQRAGRGS